MLISLVCTFTLECEVSLEGNKLLIIVADITVKGRFVFNLVNLSSYNDSIRHMIKLGTVKTIDAYTEFCGLYIIFINFITECALFTSGGVKHE